MRPIGRFLLIDLVLTLLCVGGWLAWRFLLPDEPGAPPVVADRPASRADPIVAPVVPAVVSESVATDERAASPDPPAAAPKPPARERVPFVLHGRLVGVAPGIPWRTPVYVVASFDSAFRVRVNPWLPRTLMGWVEDGHDDAFIDAIERFDPVVEAFPRWEALASGREKPPHQQPDGDGRFAIDVRGLFQDDWPRTLTVVASDPGYLPVTQDLFVANRIEGAMGVLPDVLLSVSPAAVVTGRVDADDRGPSARTAPLRVVAGLFRKVGGAPTGVALDALRLDRRDRYLLRAPADGEYVVVIAGRHYSPVSRGAFLTVGHALELPSLLVTAGASITGTVTRRGGEAAAHPAAPVTVRVELELLGGAAHPVALPDHDLGWRDGEVLVRGSSGLLELSGGECRRFEFLGLRPGERYRVRVAGSGPGADGHGSAEVLAGADGPPVALEVAGAALRVSVSGSFRPVEQARVALTPAAAGDEATDGQGRAYLLVEPGRTYQVLVEAEGYQPARAEVEIPESGRGIHVLVDLKRMATGIELAVEVAIDPHLKARVLRLRFVPVAPTGGAPFQREVVEEQGLFSFDALPPGRYRVSIDRAIGEDGAGRSMKLRGADLLEHARELVFTGSDRLRETIRVRTGGRLSIEAVDGETRGLPAKCEVFDAAGRPMPVTFAAWIDGSQPFEQIEWASWEAQAHWSAKSSIRRHDFLIGSLPSVVEPALPPGKYRVELSLEGREKRVVDVELEAGKVSKVCELLARLP